ncbi:hypothetical protein [Kurthia huakuii]|uniref:hypothetical protein n=1 Tax=Kurthia huakuii TaxID=1421019 RepID=UPI000496AF9B|nr:hypothetical protein [Kurthia huakuii]MBM7699111.1 hypothetical protein [Kurthia huakuii]
MDIQKYDQTKQRVTLQFSAEEWGTLCQLLKGQRYEQTVPDKILSIASHIETQEHFLARR